MFNKNMGIIVFKKIIIVLFTDIFACTFTFILVPSRGTKVWSRAKI